MTGRVPPGKRTKAGGTAGGVPPSTLTGQRTPLSSRSVSRRSPIGTRLNVVPHRHPTGWYLCDRSYSSGRRRHLIRGSFGKSPPKLYAPEVRSGIAEDVLPRLVAGSFDLIYLDPPYGTTAGAWDKAPDWPWLASEVARLLAPSGQVVLHGAGGMAIRAASAFMVSLRHRFEVVWIKGRPPGPVRSTPWVSDAEPLRAHELVHIFAHGEAKTSDLTFNPAAMHRRGRPWHSSKRGGPTFHDAYRGGEFRSDGWRLPVDVLFAQPTHEGNLYAAKPEDLVTYLIATLTNPGDTILDPYTGSGTTLVVAHRLGRRSFGLEANPESWKILMSNTCGLRGTSSPNRENPEP